MNERLHRAGEEVLRFVSDLPYGVTIEEIHYRFRGDLHEVELTAAIWNLRADGVIDFNDDLIRRIS